MIYKPISFIRATIYPAVLPHNIVRGHYLPRGGKRGLLLNFQPIYFISFIIYHTALPHNISKGHYLPSKIYCLVFARPLFTLVP
jgi:hypothetical protein